MPILSATMSTGINTIARRTRGGFTSSATASGTGSTSAAAISAAQANARAAISFQSAINNRAAIGTLYLSNGTLSTGTSTLIGNAYSDEILHAARLSPLTWTQRLAPDEIARLYDATRATLALWIERLRAEVQEIGCLLQ